MQANTAPDRHKFWQRATFWTAVAGVLTALAGFVDPRYQIPLLKAAAALGSLSSIFAGKTGTAAAVQVAQTGSVTNAPDVAPASDAAVGDGP